MISSTPRANFLLLLLQQRLQYPLRRQRQAPQPDSEGSVDGIRNRRSDAVDADLGRFLLHKGRGDRLIPR